MLQGCRAECSLAHLGLVCIRQLAIETCSLNCTREGCTQRRPFELHHLVRQRRQERLRPLAPIGVLHQCPRKWTTVRATAARLTICRACCRQRSRTPRAASCCKRCNATMRCHPSQVLENLICICCRDNGKTASALGIKYFSNRESDTPRITRNCSRCSGEAGSRHVFSGSDKRNSQH